MQNSLHLCNKNMEWGPTARGHMISGEQKDVDEWNEFASEELGGRGSAQEGGGVGELQRDDEWGKT